MRHTGRVSMNPVIFREYDIRGVAEVDFDVGFARCLGRAYASYLAAQASRAPLRERPLIGVGRDCRVSSDGYAAALREGLRECGCDVVDLGVCPTPLCYFSLFDLALDGGIQVTGSHNPADQNGFKICVGKTSLHGDQIQALRDHMEAGHFPTGTGRERRFDVITRYQEYLASRVPILSRPLHLVVDAGNATAGPVAPAIFRAMGARVDELYCELDGRFPHHHPDPTVEENLRDLAGTVRAVGAEIGIAFDGDADRIGVVDHNGRPIWGDELLILFARDVLRRIPGATIVSEVKCSQRLFDDIAARGGKAIMWKVGHSPIKAKMRETGAALGGEMSGHMFFADRYFGYDDGIYAACRILEILSHTGRRVEELLADLPRTYTTPEIRVECADSLKFELVDRIGRHFRNEQEVVTVDGVRVKLRHGWGLVRASNTQPALVLRFEADSEEALSEYRQRFEDLLARIRRDLE
jgi:phosphomannomutase/phosphoglucomutase